MPPLEGGIVPSLGLLRQDKLPHSRKDRPPHTGHLGPWDPPSAPAAGWSPGERTRGETAPRLTNPSQSFQPHPLSSFLQTHFIISPSLALSSPYTAAQAFTNRCLTIIQNPPSEQNFLSIFTLKQSYSQISFNGKNSTRACTSKCLKPPRGDVVVSGFTQTSVGHSVTQKIKIPTSKSWTIP